MKTSIFNMTFTLPPMVEITEVEKGMTIFATAYTAHGCRWMNPHC